MLTPLSQLFPQQLNDWRMGLKVLSAVVDELARLHAARQPCNWLSPHSILVELDERNSTVRGVAVQKFASQKLGRVPMSPRYNWPESHIDATTPSQELRRSQTADIYVLGFIFYELLLGREQFKELFGSTDQEPYGWLRWHADLNRQAPALSSLRPDLPPQLTQIMARMMEKQIAARYRSFDELQDELHDLKGVAGGSDGRALHRLGLAAIAAMALLIVGVGLIVLLHKLRTMSPNPAPQAGPPEIQTATGPMVAIPGGRFLMGSDDGPLNERPAHQVNVEAFYLDQYEVTGEQYRKYLVARQLLDSLSAAEQQELNASPKHPAHNLSPAEAHDFCAWADKRLPTEAEWELAARGTEGRLYPWGNDEKYLPGTVNFRTGILKDAGESPTDKSSYGVMDLAGNLPEYVAGEFAAYEGNTELKPVSAASIIRGGGFQMTMERKDLRASSREPFISPRVRTGLLIGFRCAADADKATQLQQR